MKHSDTTSAPGAMDESDRSHDSEPASNMHDHMQIGAAPLHTQRSSTDSSTASRNGQGTCGHFIRDVLFLISCSYAAARDFNSFAVASLFLMLVGSYDRMQSALRASRPVAASVIFCVESHRDAPFETLGSGSLNPNQLGSSSQLESDVHVCGDEDTLHDEHVHISDTEGLVAPEDALLKVEDCDITQRPPLLEIDQDIFTVKSQDDNTQATGYLKNWRSLNAFEFDLDLLPPKSDGGDNRPREEQSLPENMEATTAQPEDCITHGTTPPQTSRTLHQMNVDGGSNQDSGEASSALTKDDDYALNKTVWLKYRPRTTAKDYMFGFGHDAFKADIPDDYVSKAMSYLSAAKTVNLETSDKATRKKERRSKRQYDKRKKETARKREIGAASLRKGEELVEHMFDSGWVPSDMHDFKLTLAVLMEDRVKIYQELVKEGWSDHGWWLHQLMSSWERESSTMTAKEKKKEKERFQLLVKGTWLEDVES